MTDSFDPYAILEVARDAPIEVLEKAWRRAAQRAHPDREGGSTERMQLVNEAWEILKDPERKRRFDATGDRAAEDPITSAAKALIAKMVGIIIRNSPPELDLVSAIRDGLVKQREGLHQARATTLEEIRVLEGRLARLRGPEGNVITRTIESEIGRGRAQLPVYDQDEKALLRAAELMKEFAWVQPFSWPGKIVQVPSFASLIGLGGKTDP